MILSFTNSAVLPRFQLCANLGLDSVRQQPVGLKGNRLQKCLAGLYFATFSTLEQLLDLKIVKIYPTPSHFRFENSPMAKKYCALPNVARLFQNAEPLSVRPRLCMTSSRHMGERAVRPRQASARTQAGRTASMRR